MINYGNCFDATRNRKTFLFGCIQAYRATLARGLCGKLSHSFHYLPVQRLSVNGQREVAGAVGVGNPKLNLTLLLFRHCGLCVCVCIGRDKI